MCGHGREGSEVRGMELRPIRMYTSTVYVISVGEHVLVGNGWSGGLVLRACKFYVEGQLGVRELPLAALEQSPKLGMEEENPFLQMASAALRIELLVAG